MVFLMVLFISDGGENDTFNSQKYWEISIWFYDSIAKKSRNDNKLFFNSNIPTGKNTDKIQPKAVS